ncbi:hypothetical protein KI387_010290, partial [Taxus chinensis]
MASNTANVKKIGKENGLHNEERKIAGEIKWHRGRTEVDLGGSRPSIGGATVSGKESILCPNSLPRGDKSRVAAGFASRGFSGAANGMSDGGTFVHKIGDGKTDMGKPNPNPKIPSIVGAKLGASGKGRDFIKNIAGCVT